MVEIRLGRKVAPRREVFADGELVVRSRKGVRPTEKALLGVLPRGRKGSALVVNSREGLLGLALKALNPELDVYCHFDDAWDLEQADRAARRHGSLPLALAVAADPPEGPWDIVVLPFSKDGVKDLLLERLEFAHAFLKPGGLVFAGTNNPRDRFLGSAVRDLFGSATRQPDPTGRLGTAYIARKPKDAVGRFRRREPSFTVREGDRVISFVSRPGVFSHKGLDLGTRVLLSTVDFGRARRVADLGCGVGVVGTVAALRSPEARVTLVDSYARAVECAQRNTERLGVAERTEVVLSARTERDLKPGYDLVVSNPPYYSNDRICGMFVATAARVLVPGGRLALVAKGRRWLERIVARHFASYSAVESKGYWVITAVKGDGKGKDT